jgi:hypothetical protein
MGLGLAVGRMRGRDERRSERKSESSSELAVSFLFFSLLFFGFMRSYRAGDAHFCEVYLGFFLF